MLIDLSCACEIALSFDGGGEVVHRFQCVWMFLPKNATAHLQNMLIDLSCACEIALSFDGGGEVVHRFQCVWMFLPKNATANLQNMLIDLSCACEIALSVNDEGEVVHQSQGVGILFSPLVLRSANCHLVRANGVLVVVPFIKGMCLVVELHNVHLLAERHRPKNANRHNPDPHSPNPYSPHLPLLSLTARRTPPRVRYPCLTAETPFLSR